MHYKDVWSPVMGELFISSNIADNTVDSHAMGIFSERNSKLLVGHLPKEISYPHFFTLHGGELVGK